MAELKLFSGYETMVVADHAASMIREMLEITARGRGGDTRTISVRPYRPSEPDGAYDLWIADTNRTIDQIRAGIVYDMLLGVANGWIVSTRPSMAEWEMLS